MIYICLVLLACLFMVCFRKSRSFIAPNILIIIISFLSCLIIGVYNEKWGYPVGYKFVGFLISALFFFSLGCEFVYVLNHSYSKEKIRLIFGKSECQKWIINYPEFFINSCSILFTVIYVSVMLSKVRISSSVTSVFRSLYDYHNSDAANSGNFLINQIQVNVMAMAYISVVAFFSKSIYGSSKKIRLSILTPVLMHCLCTLFNTDRNFFLRFTIFSIVIWILFYKNKPFVSKHRINKDIVKKGVVIVVIFVVIFFILGKLKQYKSNFASTISIYGGSGFYNFSYYLENFYTGKDLELGKNLFYRLSNTLRYIGILGGKSEIELHGQGFVYGRAGYGSNIYSALYEITKDFGLVGVCILMFLEGTFFSLLYNFTLKKGYGFGWIFYASVIYPVIYFPISEQLFKRMHLGVIYEVFWVIFWYFFVSTVRIKQHRQITVDTEWQDYGTNGDRK